MGAIHAVMQGEFQVVLVYFREASAFVSMTNTASTDIIGFTLNKRRMCARARLHGNFRLEMV